MNQTHNGLDAGAVPLRVHAVQGANAAVTATLPAVAGWLTVFTGYDYTGTGATVGAAVDIAVSGQFTRKLVVPANPLQPIVDSVRPPNGLAMGSANTGCTVTVPALGAGNLGGHLVVYGYRVKG